MKKLLFFLIGMFICIMVSAQWESDPAVNNPITPAGFGVMSPSILDGKTSTFIAYQSPTPTYSNIGIYMQIFDREGVKQFSDTGLLISAATTPTSTSYTNILFIDNEGNAIIANTVGEYTSTATITLYKVSPNGTMLWTTNGIALSENTNYGGCYLQMIQLRSNDYIFAWMNMNQGTISLRRISPSDGTLLGTEYTMTTPINGYPYLVPADANNFILVYAERHTTGNPWNRYAWIMAKKFNENLALQWTSTVYQNPGGFSIPTIQGIWDVESDGADGALIAWYDANVNSNREDAYVVRILPDGTFGTASTISNHTNAMRIGSDAILRSLRPHIIADPINDCFYATWLETNANQSATKIKVQKYDLTTYTELWSPGGIELDNGTVDYASVQLAPNNEAVIFWQKIIQVDAIIYSYAARLDQNGNYVWDGNHINFTTSPDYRAGLVSTPLIDSTFYLTMWQDKRGDNDFYDNPIFLQRINLDGTLGASVVVIENCDPPTNAQVVFGELSSDETTLSVNITWEGDAATYNFAYKENNAANWIDSIVIGNSINLELPIATQFNYQIQSICDNLLSDWFTDNFITPEESNITNGQYNPHLNIYADNGMLYIKNDSHATIDNVQIYAYNGALLQQYTVKNEGDIELPVSQKTSIVLVRISGSNINASYKVLIK